MELEQLVKGCLNKDIRCQENFFKKYYGKLMAIAVRMTPNREVAEDLLQNAFIKIFNSLGSLKSYEPDVVYAWCKVIVRNTIIDYHRGRKVYEISFDDSLDLPFEDTGYDMDYLESKKVTPNKIIRALQNLPPKYNLVFNLHVIDGYRHDEISKMLNINIGTSKSNLSKAKDRLRKELTS